MIAYVLRWKCKAGLSGYPLPPSFPHPYTIYPLSPSLLCISCPRIVIKIKQTVRQPASPVQPSECRYECMPSNADNNLTPKLFFPKQKELATLNNIHQQRNPTALTPHFQTRETCISARTWKTRGARERENERISSEPDTSRMSHLSLPR